MVSTATTTTNMAFINPKAEVSTLLADGRDIYCINISHREHDKKSDPATERLAHNFAPTSD